MVTAALIIVNYKSADLAIDAIRGARSAGTVPLQVVAVDNSVDRSQADALAAHTDTLIVAERNLGYAAAINRARRVCNADVLVVSNPDVHFASGAIDRLLDTDAAVAGPALFWDDAFSWMLPPSELQTAAQVMDRVAASHSAVWARSRDRRRIRERIEFWSLRQPTKVRALSGAVLAIRSEAFDRAGGFDERFHLYFEENDFLRRVRGDIVYRPDARCRHIYNQSAGASAAAAETFARSERAYLGKWNGRIVAGAMKALERTRKVGPFIEIGDTPIRVPPGSLVEASPLPAFETAAGHFPSGSNVAVPPEVWNAYRGERLYLRVIDRAGGFVVASYARSKIRA